MPAHSKETQTVGNFYSFIFFWTIKIVLFHLDFFLRDYSNFGSK